SYLTARRAWSAQLSGSTLGPIDLSAWGPFLERMERRPLLMHLLGAFFDGPDDQAMPTPARLGARLVEQQPAPALSGLPAGLLACLPSAAPHNLRRWALTGLSRAARSPWTQRQHAAAQPRQHLLDVMLDPQNHLPAVPQRDYWRGGFSPYWCNEAGLAPHLMALVDLVCGSPWVSCPDEDHYRLGPPVV